MSGRPTAGHRLRLSTGIFLATAVFLRGVLLWALLGAFAGAPAVWAQAPVPEAPVDARWFSSDPLGSVGEAVSTEAAQELEYALQRFVHDGRTVERLYGQGALLEERVSGGDVETLRAYLPDGSLEYEERLYRYPDGAPREIRRTSAEEERIYRYRRTTGLPFEEWYQRGEERKVWRFGPGGRIVESITWEGEEMLVQERFSYSPDGSLAEAVREDLSEAEVRLRRYADGRLVVEELRREDRPGQTTRFTYDSAGRLIQEVREDPDGSLVLDYEYDEEGEIKLERRRRNNQVTLLVRYTETGRIEDRYRRGALVLRSFFEGDTRVREELYREGRLITVRGEE